MNKRLIGAAAALLLIGVGAGSLLFTAPAKADAKPCGSISYMVGQATITRASGGRPVAADISVPIYNNDLIQTKDKSRVDIAMDKSTGFSGTVKVSAKTSFYFKLSQVAGEPATALELMAGSVGMKVARMAGSPSAQVRTDSAVCGVRGTGFNVTVAPTGDLLVTCEEGKVGLYGVDDSGQLVEDDEADVEPGVVVQRAFGEGFSLIKKDPADLDSYQSSWMNDRIEALRSDPGRALGAFAARYLRKRPDFDRAFSPLESSAAFKRWQRESGKAFDPTGSQNIQENKEISPLVMNVRKEGRLLERYYFRLAEIRSYLEGTAAWDQSIGIDETGAAVRPGAKAAALTARSFFARFDRDSKELTRKMAVFHAAETLLIQRSPFGAGAPGSGMGNGSFFDGPADKGGSDSFFGDAAPAAPSASGAPAPAAGASAPAQSLLGAAAPAAPAPAAPAPAAPAPATPQKK